MGIPFVGRIVLKIAKIYDGSCVSLICEAREVLIEEVFVPPSIFDEYPDAEKNTQRFCHIFVENFSGIENKSAISPSTIFILVMKSSCEYSLPLRKDRKSTSVFS